MKNEDWYVWRRHVVNILRDNHNDWDITEQDRFERMAWIAWASNETPEDFANRLVSV